MISFQPLGDRAVLVYCVDEDAAARFAEGIRRVDRRWLVDVVQAYTSVAVFFDLQQTRYANVVTVVQQVSSEVDAQTATQPAGKLHIIPCCYDMQLDLSRIAEHTGLTDEEIVHIHSQTVFTVYAIGFCPGFPYLGYLPPELSGVPRLSTPRVRVEAGSVGLTGRQTGIYTEPRPGGWNLLGRTPLELVSVRDAYFPIRTGDRVRFSPISSAEFQRLLGTRL